MEICLEICVCACVRVQMCAKMGRIRMGDCIVGFILSNQGKDRFGSVVVRGESLQWLALVPMPTVATLLTCSNTFPLSEEFNTGANTLEDLRRELERLSVKPQPFCARRKCARLGEVSQEDEAVEGDRHHQSEEDSQE